ncbi:MAG TPA: hypothetical protein DCR97_01735, partial [Deltaproteobacteria bacterium]|nr:hypothetical protein [Deltaproteobacteria bacterium]
TIFPLPPWAFPAIASDILQPHGKWFPRLSPNAHTRTKKEDAASVFFKELLGTQGAHPRRCGILCFEASCRKLIICERLSRTEKAEGTEVIPPFLVCERPFS